MKHMTHPLSSADISIFFTRNQQILLHQEMQIYIVFWYIISNSFNFSWVFVILIMSAKMATPGLLKPKNPLFCEVVLV